MTPYNKPKTLDEAWTTQLAHIIRWGAEVAPRGQKTFELLHSTVNVDMNYPVLTLPERKLSYRFMAAEAFWILSGSRLVSDIAPFNKHISQFSDDGFTFAGAYGPKIVEQLRYVAQKLREDPMSRQAVMTIWERNPKPSKDIPCTVAIAFQLRDGKLHTSVFMRSSDVWLGLPYDIFNFTMLSQLVCLWLEDGAAVEGGDSIGRNDPLVRPALGTLSLTAASSHLYERNIVDAQHLLAAYERTHLPALAGREFPQQKAADLGLMDYLESLRDSKPGDEIRFWEDKGA